VRGELLLDKPAYRWDMETKAALAAGWLDGAICLALQSSVEGAEPPLAVWTGIRRRVLRARPEFDGEDAARSEVSAETFGRCEMSGWSDILARQERYADLRREAERERLVRQVLAGRDTRNRFARQALTWLGQRLVTWGCHLQERYGAAASAFRPAASSQRWRTGEERSAQICRSRVPTVESTCW